jgi:hypothetical protein
MTGALYAFGAAHQIGGLWLGSGLMGLNLGLVSWVGDRLLQKKSIAMASTLVVTKYAVFLGLLIILSLLGWSMDFGFALGIGAVFPTLGYMGYKYLKSS